MNFMDMDTGTETLPCCAYPDFPSFFPTHLNIFSFAFLSSSFPLFPSIPPFFINYEFIPFILEFWPKVEIWYFNSVDYKYSVHVQSYIYHYLYSMLSHKLTQVF